VTDPAGVPAADKPFRRLSPLTPVARGPILFVAAIGASWQELLDGDVIGVTGAIILGALLVGVAWGIASWWRTKYWIDGDELRVDTGVVSRQSRRIRIDRLQGIDIVQPFVARLMGLAELRMDVAGGDRREGSLAFLPVAEARELRTLLLARRDATRRGTLDAPAPGPAGAWAPGAPAPRQQVPGESVPGERVPEEEVLARLDLGLLVASLALSGRTFSFALGMVVLVASLLTGAVAGVATLVPVVIGAGVLVVRDFTGFYGFTVSESAAGVQVRRGLASLTSQTIALHRVQGVVVSEPWLWRRFGWARLDVSVAGYGSPGDEEGASTTILPIGPSAQAAALARHLLRGLDPAAVPLSPPPREARWAAPVVWRFLRWGMDERLAVGRAGLLVRRTHCVPHARAQSWTVQQGPWQRRLGVADLRVDSPPGPVRARARHLRTLDTRAELESAVRYGRAARMVPGLAVAQPSSAETSTEQTTR
jgi:putative membrane protein